MQSYFLSIFILIVLINGLFIARNRLKTVTGWLHGVSITLSQSFLTLFIPGLFFILSYGLCRLIGFNGPAAEMVSTCISAFFASLILIVLILDYKLSQMFGFHINGYVLNVLFTDGGLEALEGGKFSAILFSSACLAIVSINLGVAYMLTTGKWQVAALMNLSSASIIVVSMLLLLNVIIDKLLYGFARIEKQNRVLTRCDMVPFYLGVTFRRIAVRIGYKPRRQHDDLNISLQSKENDLLSYPSVPLKIAPLPTRPHLIILPVESWRWDMLTPEIMPKTSAWVAERGHSFCNHFSTGNATRMALFGLFYGIYPPYWFPIIDMQQPPVIMQTVQELGYDIHAYSSTGFTYPEFDKTLFSGLPKARLHDIESDIKWQRDVILTDTIIEQITGNHAQKKPTFVYGFYNTTHARYDFPEDQALLPDYEKRLNYVTTNIKKHIDAIRNRYINSCHFLDSQFDRLLSSLNEAGILDNSVIVIFGDHGEEFMDNGAWGHNSSFLDAQTRVPMLFFLPDGSSGTYDFMTSHLDIPATLAPFLGIANDLKDYTQGNNMLTPGFERRYAVMGAWSTLGILFEDAVYSTPLNPRRQFKRAITDRNGQRLTDEKTVLKKYQADLLDIIRELGRFRQNRPS